MWDQAGTGEAMQKGGRGDAGPVRGRGMSADDPMTLPPPPTIHPTFGKGRETKALKGAGLFAAGEAGGPGREGDGERGLCGGGAVEPRECLVPRRGRTPEADRSTAGVGVPVCQ